MRKRVVITGLGTVNPLGNNVADFWQGIREGRSGVAPITRFDATEYQTKIAAEVKNFNAADFMDRKEARKMDLFSQYAVAASLEAMRDAGLMAAGVAAEGSVSEGASPSTAYDPTRLGVILGIGIGGFQTIEDSYWQLYEKGPSRVPPMTIPKLIANIGPGNVAIAINAQGPVYSLATACASGTDALGNALRWIGEGHGDVVVAGGVEACVTRLGVSGFNVIQALSTAYNDQPEKASRPFDKNRDGFVIGEGAGILVCEEYEHARARGARIYAELAGSGVTCDANHLTSPHPEGRGAIAAVKMALNDAGLAPTDIDYINAHGTSTPVNDPIETSVIKQVFGDHAYRLKVSSTKSMHGHLIGAAGGVEAIVCVLAIRDQYFPPTINLDEPDEGCDLDYVPHRGVEGTIRTTLSNSLGFGGHNGVVILRSMQ